MTVELSPKELARIKREARARRIGAIRRRVLAFGATLAVVFSAVVLARTEINQPASGSSTRSDLAQPAPVQSQDESGGEFNSGDLGGAIAGIVTSALGDSGDDSSNSSSSSPDSAPLTTSQS